MNRNGEERRGGGLISECRATCVSGVLKDRLLQQQQLRHRAVRFCLGVLSLLSCFFHPRRVSRVWINLCSKGGLCCAGPLVGGALVVSRPVFVVRFLP